MQTLSATPVLQPNSCYFSYYTVWSIHTCFNFFLQYLVTLGWFSITGTIQIYLLTYLLI